MRKQFLFNDCEMDSIYDLLVIAKEVSETFEEKERINDIIKIIDEQTNYYNPSMKQFAITAPGFEFPDYVYANTREEALIEWAETIVCAEVVEIEKDEA